MLRTACRSVISKHCLMTFPRVKQYTNRKNCTKCKLYKHYGICTTCTRGVNCDYCWKRTSVVIHIIKVYTHCDQCGHRRQSKHSAILTQFTHCRLCSEGDSMLKTGIYADNMVDIVRACDNRAHVTTQPTLRQRLRISLLMKTVQIVDCIRILNCVRSAFSVYIVGIAG